MGVGVPMSWRCCSSICVSGVMSMGCGVFCCVGVVGVSLVVVGRMSKDIE